MKLFDTHCHVNFEAFKNDYQDVILRSQKNHIDMLVVGTDLKTSKKAIELAKKFSGVWAAVGFHPIHIQDRQWKEEIKAIARLARENCVRAIGEIGLDNFYFPPAEYAVQLKKQRQILDFFLSVAGKNRKPLIFHARGWNEELKETLALKLSIIKRVGAVWHCFSGDEYLARWWTDQGFYLGFNGLITKNAGWDKIIKKVSLNKILLETDAPYLTPRSLGKIRNEPLYIKLVAEHIAELKGITFKQVAETTHHNTLQFLGIKR